MSLEEGIREGVRGRRLVLGERSRWEGRIRSVLPGQVCSLVCFSFSTWAFNFSISLFRCSISLSSLTFSNASYDSVSDRTMLLLLFPNSQAGGHEVRDILPGEYWPVATGVSLFDQKYILSTLN